MDLFSFFDCFGDFISQQVDKISVCFHSESSCPLDLCTCNAFFVNCKGLNNIDDILHLLEDYFSYHVIGFLFNDGTLNIFLS